MASKIITIVGITGNQVISSIQFIPCILTYIQGASVAEAFLSEVGWKIHGISRDPSKASSKAWSDKGVEIVAADLDDAAAMNQPSRARTLSSA
jgi:hypothetical protein